MPETTAQAAPTRQRHNSLIHRHHPSARPSWRNAAALVGLVLPLLVLLPISPAHAARLALVVGNADYADSPLKNPVNDARAMHAKLASLGFDVTPVENLRRRDIGRTVNGFASRIRPGDEVVVFYAGHGLQVRGINYLPAVDADIQSEEDVPLNSLNLNTLLERMDDAKAGVKLLFLDACRNNPYARSFRSSARGLARVQDAPSGTLMHFATRPGSVAADGSGKNGLYTTELLRHIDQPGTPIEQMLKRVAAAVERESKGQQEPWVEGSLKGDFYFKPGSGVQVASVTPVATGLPVQVQPDAEQEAWEIAKRRDTVASYQVYLNRYPSGRYAQTARDALEGLQPTTIATPTPAPAPRPVQQAVVQAASPTPPPPALESVRPVQPSPIVSQQQAPWSAGKLVGDSAANRIALAEWRSAGNRNTCLPLGFSSTGNYHGKPRRANYHGGWAVAFDTSDIRSAYGIAGAGVDASTDDELKRWPYFRGFADGSAVGYGLSGGEKYSSTNQDGLGEENLAYLRIQGQGCSYNIWSKFGRKHLELLIRELRFILTK